jgi:2-keto-4-pentenoate hydratase/2-oxohepta-3-ene-1,7-dioic acid hydratase in catechol pathway
MRALPPLLAWQVHPPAAAQHQWWLASRDFFRRRGRPATGCAAQQRSAGPAGDLALGPSRCAHADQQRPPALDDIRERLDRAGPGALSATTRPIHAVRLHSPFRPGKIIGVGFNYVEHVEESSLSLDRPKELPIRPVLFSKPATAVVGPGEPIQHNGNLTAQLDWQCELAVVIGRSTRRVGWTQALAHVFGYSIINDISARDQRRSGQWFFSKGQDSYAPFGPAIRTADEVPNPQVLDLGLRVNGSVKQWGSTAHVLFTVAELIADISSGVR